MLLDFFVDDMFLYRMNPHLFSFIIYRNPQQKLLKTSRFSAGQDFFIVNYYMFYIE